MADLGDGEWAEVVATNLTGIWLSMKHQITHMRAQAPGFVVGHDLVIDGAGTP